MNLMHLAASFLPQGAAPLVIVGIALALMLGLVPMGKAKALLGSFLLSLLLLPFLPALIGALPWWLALLVLAWMLGSMVGLVARTLMGKSAWAELKAKLALRAWDRIWKLCHGLVAWPLRLTGRGLRWLWQRPPRQVPAEGPGVLAGGD